jgi:hypothetical protein
MFNFVQNPDKEMDMLIDMVGEILRVGVGILCGVLAIDCFLMTVRVSQDPARYERRRRVAVAIKRYKKGEITSKELERMTPVGSLQYGLACTITPPYQLVRSVQINVTF